MLSSTAIRSSRKLFFQSWFLQFLSCIFCLLAAVAAAGPDNEDNLIFNLVSNASLAAFFLCIIQLLLRSVFLYAITIVLLSPYLIFHPIKIIGSIFFLKNAYYDPIFTILEILLIIAEISLLVGMVLYFVARLKARNDT